MSEPANTVPTDMAGNRYVDSIATNTTAPPTSEQAKLSDTPETNAFERTWDSYNYPFEAIKFAHTLEINLTAAQARIVELDALLEQEFQENDCLRERAEKAERDLKAAQDALAGVKQERDDIEAMYAAQCRGTDEWVEKYEAERERKADATLLARVAELEQSLATVNQRLSDAQSPFLQINAAIAQNGGAGS